MDIAERTLTRVKSIFGVDDVALEVREDAERTIPETGAGGFTPDSHTIFVYFDSKNPYFAKNFEREIKSTVAHEFHHAVRNRAFNWEKDTLFGAMITEGLADHFDLEMNGGTPHPWSVSLSDEELKRVEEMAAPEFGSREYNYNEWFFGSLSRDIPRWTGYALGFKFVGDYIRKTGKKASELVTEPPESFFEW